jgi:type I restriction enzyme M protein
MPQSGYEVCSPASVLRALPQLATVPLADSPRSWGVDAKTIDRVTFDLSVKNPNGGETVTHRSPREIMEEIAALDAESGEVLGKIKAVLK